MIFLLAIAVLCALIYWYYKQVYLFNKPLAKFPTPPYVPILGHALDFASKDNLAVLTRYTQTYGPIVRVKSGPKRTLLLVSDYKFLQFILTSTKILDKSIDYHHVNRWLGTGLLTGSGAKWRRNRHFVTRAFHFKILEDFVEVFEANAKVLVKKLERHLEEDSVDVCPLLTLCTLDIICETTMGTSVNAQDNSESDYVKSVKEMCRIIVERAFSPHKMFDLVYFFTEDFQIEKKALQVLHNYSKQVINKRLELRESSSTPETKQKALLDLLLDAQAGDHVLTLEELRQEVDTFMFAGHDTTASTLTFIIYNLATYPEIQAKVLEEQRRIFAEDFQRSSTFQDLKEMNYLEQVIKESLRLYPPVPFVGREVKEEVFYEGDLLPKGLTLTLFLFGIHRNPELFPDPEKFDPGRFEETDTEHPFAFLPFSAGPRNCIGQKFAMAEIKTVVSRLVRSFQILQTTPEHRVKLAAEAVLLSKNGVRVNLNRRM